MGKNIFSQFTVKPKGEIEKEFAVTTGKGLSQEQIDLRQKKSGRNEIKTVETAWQQILIRQLTSPFTYLLFGASIIAFFLNQKIDSLFILLFVGINTLLGFYQEYHSEKTVRLLKQFVRSRARVRREGNIDTIDSKQLVPGDVIIIETGDIIPADIRILEADNLTVNESALTGESQPVEKNSSALKLSTGKIYEAINIGFSGTIVVNGKAEGIVFATGANTQIGNITKLTSSTKRQSVFERDISRFSTFILRMIIVTLIFIILANLLIKGTSNLPDLLIFSIALAVSVIPEALPTVTTFSLSRGALRLAKNKIVVKRLSAIEDLGSIEILATDKTGTLTENSLTVDRIYGEFANRTLYYCALASSFLAEREKEPNNAFDLAVWSKISSSERINVKEFKRLHEVPFDPLKRRNTVSVENGKDYFLISRGAPEEIIRCCSKIENEKDLRKWIIEEGKKGNRILAVGVKNLTSARDKEINRENLLTFQGAISFADPIKNSVFEAVKKAKGLNIKVKILTGDTPEVAVHVALQIGLIGNEDDVITGDEFEKTAPEKRKEIAEKYAVFARVSPQQKFQIIQILQEHHEVGFLGEGINDAPALKAANVALVVNEASDIAREAADIILLKKSLRTIINGIEEGRTVFANTTKYIKATLSSNFGNFYAVAIASLIIDYLPMLPLQLLLVNLLSDFPMIAIATDNIDSEELKKPRSYNIKEIAFLATILGLISTIFDFIFFALYFRRSPSELHTYWFIGSILTELVFLFSIRSMFPFFKAKSPSLILFLLTGIAMVTTIIIPFTMVGQNTFQFIRPSLRQLIYIIDIVVIYFMMTESVKLLYYHHFSHRNNKI